MITLKYIESKHSLIAYDDGKKLFSLEIGDCESFKYMKHYGGKIFYALVAMLTLNTSLPWMDSNVHDLLIDAEVVIMTYSELIEYMHMFRLGEISKKEMGSAIHLWQLAKGYKVVA